MSQLRLERLNSEMQRNISEIINGGLRDEELKSMVSVMSVDVTRDLKHAKIALSIYGKDDDKKADFEAVCRAKGFIKKELAFRMKHMRQLPELHFSIDNSMEYSAHINQLLDEIKADKE